MNNLKIVNKLIVITGLPCSGKSILSESLSKELKIPLFSVDPIESAILKSGIKRSFETGLSAYLIAKDLACEQLKLNISVIIDAVSPVIEARNMWIDLAKETKSSLFILECQLEEELHKKRVEKRVRNMEGIPEVTWDYVQKIREMYLPWSEDRLIINTANNTEDNVKKALDYIYQY